MMKKLILLFNLFIISVLAFAQDDEYATLSPRQETEIFEIATLWVEEVFKAEDIGKLMEISDVPFAVAQEEVLTDRVDLETFYKKVFKDKGKRPVPKLNPRISEYRLETLGEDIPFNFVNVEILIEEQDNQGVVTVCVTLKNDEYKVVGFDD